METERALPDPRSALSSSLRLVAARERGVGPEQLPWIGTDPDVFEAFYSEHVEEVQRFVARRVANRERAADLTAEIFLAAVESAHRYRPGRGTPRAWLYGIARILVANDRRRDSREQAREERLRGSALLDTDDATRMDARIDAAAPSRRLYAAMDRLPEAVLELVAVDELSSSPGTKRPTAARSRRPARDGQPPSQIHARGALLRNRTSGRFSA
jgi:RNA polymerase sigma factor (sigma-70 family)